MPGFMRTKKVSIAGLENVAISISYEDIEGLLVNVGVVAALMMSMSVAVTYAYYPSSADCSIFTQNIIQNPNFRVNFVVPYVQSIGMNMTQNLGQISVNDDFEPTGGRQVINVIDSLLDGWDNSQGYIGCNTVRSGASGHYDGCANYEITGFLILSYVYEEDVDEAMFWKMKAWLRFASKAETGQMMGSSALSSMFYLGSVATVLFNLEMIKFDVQVSPPPGARGGGYVSSAGDSGVPSHPHPRYF